MRSTKKVAFGTAKFSPIESVSYLSDEGAFEVRFSDGVTITESEAAIRAANQINPKAIFEKLWIDEELQQGFFVQYHTGEIAEVSWAFVRELAPEAIASESQRSVETLLTAPPPTTKGRSNHQLQPEFVSDSSLSWALQHMLRYGDTDVFPIAFEYLAFKSVWSDLLSTLRKTDLANHELGPAIRMMVPKHTTGYRSAAQLDPLDTLLFAGLVYEMAPVIEGFRVPADRRIACAYRLEIDADGQFFRKDPGWTDFHEQSKANVKSKSCSHVISADITDFYNQISHHRIQNALSGAGVPENRSKVTERLLGNFNALHHSRGIPVGPSASILLAECALADVDNFLLRQQLPFTRYVDDFRIFCSSEEEAVRAFHALSEYLFTAHRLSLQGGKTVILTKSDFRKQELSDPAELERTKKSTKISALIKTASQYGGEEVEIDEVEKEALRNTIGELLDQVLEAPSLPLGLARYVLRRAGTLRTRIILQKTIRNADRLLPVLRDLVVYWCKVFDKKRPEQVGEILRYLLRESPHRTIPFVQYWALTAFETEPSFCSAPEAIHAAEASDSLIAGRMAALLARKHNVVDWVRSKKEIWSNTSAWTQRAIIWSSSILPRDERKHWLKPICNYPVASNAAIAKAVSALSH
ncbi:MAG TPA: RNA-directed DNA polymerase [Candidatus Binatia bacterium]